MKKALTALLIPLTLLTLCSCGNKITEGEVYEKHYEPANTQTIMQPKPMLGLNGRVNLIMMPEQRKTDEKWVIKIKNSNGKTAEVYVSERVYKETQIGDWFDN